MRVRVITPGDSTQVEIPSMHRAGTWPPNSPWRARAVLGAQSPGALRLPDAHPTASTLYAPRGVWVDDNRIIVCDTGNHRVLIWSGHPDRDGTDAHVVLGQPDMVTEGQATGGPALGMNLPTGVLIHDGRLVVADAWHHRLLMWDRVPTATGTSPDQVLGQPDPLSVEPNAGSDATASTFYWPFGIAVVDGRFVVADTGNRRVLIWTDGLPEQGQPADVVLGQPTPSAREENRGGPVAADSFRWPHAVAGTGAGGILVADAGNHRLLQWDHHPEHDQPANAVVGQPDFLNGTEFPYISQRGRLRFPYAVSTGDRAQGLAIADTANNRVLIWDDITQALTGDADHVLGQPDLAANGENRWDAVGADTVCWPYGLGWHGDLLAIADSGNNRVVLWERSP